MYGKMIFRDPGSDNTHNNDDEENTDSADYS